jgi:hypothetical protein
MAVALRAMFIRDSGQHGLAFVFSVTTGAIRGECLILVMDRPIVTLRTSLVGNASPVDLSPQGRMALSALLIE